MSTNRASLLNGLRTGGVRSTPTDDLFPQYSSLNPNSAPFSPARFHHPDPQLSPYHQLQLMQLEILRLQNAQAQRNQQVQAAVLAEALRQQARRSPLPLVPPSPSFDLPPPVRRPSQAELLKAQLRVPSVPQLDDQVPIGGRFGLRMTPSTVAFPSLPDAPPQSSSPPKQFVLPAGLSRGGSPPHQTAKENTPSRSDAAPSWRRNNTSHSVLNGLRAASNASPSVKITPPPEERPSTTSSGKLRPRPLSFTSIAASNIPIVAVDSGSEHEDAMSSPSSASQSNPATPQSVTSREASPLSPREEATKKLYDGLGIGRPVPYAVQPPVLSFPQRIVSHPLRQPRGPPSGADELGPKNFATRIRRKAIGGLGVLMDARERRESIEVY